MPESQYFHAAFSSRVIFWSWENSNGKKHEKFSRLGRGMLSELHGIRPLELALEKFAQADSTACDRSTVGRCIMAILLVRQKFVNMLVVFNWCWAGKKSSESNFKLVEIYLRKSESKFYYIFKSLLQQNCIKRTAFLELRLICPQRWMPTISIVSSGNMTYTLRDVTGCTM